MPEASMNENGNSAFWQNDIRLAWEIAPMQPISISEPMQTSSHSELRIGVA
jgi:hypothetical protein